MKRRMLVLKTEHRQPIYFESDYLTSFDLRVSEGGGDRNRITLTHHEARRLAYALLSEVERQKTVREKKKHQAERQLPKRPKVTARPSV